MDHLDRPSLRRLENHATTVVTAQGTSDLLRVKRYRSVHELRWDGTCQVGPAKVRAFEVKHWGARTRTDVHRGYNGYLIEAGRYRIVFGGDTAYTDAFRRIRSSKPVDLAIMPIGAYDPWIHAHCNPEQALAMANHAGAEFVLPVHHQTFKLSNEPYREPIERLLRASGSAGIASPSVKSATNFISRSDSACPRWTLGPVSKMCAIFRHGNFTQSRRAAKISRRILCAFAPLREKWGS